MEQFVDELVKITESIEYDTHADEIVTMLEELIQKKRPGYKVPDKEYL